MSGGKAAAAVFASVLGGGTGIGTARPTLMGSNIASRLTGAAGRVTGTAAGLALDSMARSTLMLRTVSLGVLEAVLAMG